MDISNNHPTPTLKTPFNYRDNARILRKLSKPVFDLWVLTFSPDTSVTATTREQQHRAMLHSFDMRCVEANLLQDMVRQFSNMEVFVVLDDAPTNLNPNTPRYDYIAMHYIMGAVRGNSIIRKYHSENFDTFMQLVERYREQYARAPDGTPIYS